MLSGINYGLQGQMMFHTSVDCEVQMTLTMIISMLAMQTKFQSNLSKTVKQLSNKDRLTVWGTPVYRFLTSFAGIN